MKIDLEPIQVLLIWNLLFSGEEPKLKDLRPRLRPKPDRKRLEDAGLIRLEKRGRATHVMLTDKAWAWAAENLDTPFSTRSPVSAGVLRSVLRRLKSYMDAREVPLAEIIGLFEPPVSRTGAGRTQVGSSEVEEAVRAAYLRLAGGSWNVRVRLALLRRDMTGIPREKLDAALLKMQDDGRLALYHLDDPLDRTPEDDQAAIDIVGHKRHIVYMRG